MIEIDKVKEVRGKYYKISIKVPYYIDTSSNIDYIVYHNYRNILDYIVSLINTKYYGDAYIDKIVDKCNNNMDVIYSNWLDDDRIFLLGSDLMHFIEGILLDSEEVELYEICHNIKRFDERFYLENDEK